MSNFPPGWDKERVQRVLRHYDSLTKEEAVAEDVAASIAVNHALDDLACCLMVRLHTAYECFGFDECGGDQWPTN